MSFFWRGRNVARLRSGTIFASGCVLAEHIRMCSVRNIGAVEQIRGVMTPEETLHAWRLARPWWIILRLFSFCHNILMSCHQLNDGYMGIAGCVTPVLGQHEQDKTRQTWFLASHQRPPTPTAYRLNFHYCLHPRKGTWNFSLYTFLA